MAGIVGLTAVLAAAPDQGGRMGTRLVMKMEAIRRAPDGGASPAVHRVLPDGSAAIELVTDGESVRRTLRGRMAGQTDGIVALVLPRPPGRLFMDPAARTCWVAKADAAPTEREADAGHGEVSRTDSFSAILGHKVQRVVASYEESRPGPGGATIRSRTEVDSWYAVDLRLPEGVASATRMRLGTSGAAVTHEFRAACPVALRSCMRTSGTPGLELVWTVTAIERTGVASTLFQVPAGYREVPAPGR